MYTVYCNNFDDAINVISRLEKKKKEFKDFMDVISFFLFFKKNLFLILMSIGMSSKPSL